MQAFLEEYHAALCDGYLLFLTEVYGTQPFRYFVELDFDWSIPESTVNEVLPLLLPLIQRTVKAHYQLRPPGQNRRAPGGSSSSSSGSQASEQAQSLQGGGSAEQGSSGGSVDWAASTPPPVPWPGPRWIVSMRTLHKVRLWYEKHGTKVLR